MALKDITIVVLTSASVSAFVTCLLKICFQHLLDRRLNLDIEKAKNQFAQDIERLRGALELAVMQQGAMTEKKLDAYPGIVEAIYRIRNMARDVSEDVGASDGSCAKVFAEKVLDLEDALYAHRYYLNADGLTKPVHDFKNCAVSFNVVLGDIAYLRGQGKQANAEARHVEAESIYKHLDELFACVNSSMEACHGPALTASVAE